MEALFLSSMVAHLITIWVLLAKTQILGIRIHTPHHYVVSPLCCVSIPLQFGNALAISSVQSHLVVIPVETERPVRFRELKNPLHQIDANQPNQMRIFLGFLAHGLLSLFL